MNIIPKADVPPKILEDSLLARIVAAYFSVAKRLERKTQCSATRGFILSTLRNGATLNQNQIATQLGLDRTVVHRAIKTMVHENLVSERKANSGRAIQVHLTPKGTRYRARLIKARKQADKTLRHHLAPTDHQTLIRLLTSISTLDF
jgi:DNA-binding MarR family transcriptional regulator